MKTQDKSDTKQSRVVDDDDKPLKKIPNRKGMKRTMKERVTEDANGYTVVEDYSSYEEYTPEELAAQKKPVP